MEDNDQERWARVEAASSELARHRADFYRYAGDRVKVVAEVLKDPSSDRATALEFLRVLPDDVPAHLAQLVELSLSQRTAPQAREAIAAGRRDIVLPKLHDEIVARLDTAEYEDYLRLAEVAARVQAWATLKSIIRSARTRHDPEVLELADEYVHAYGALVA